MTRLPTIKQIVFPLLLCLPVMVNAKQSTCYGTTKNGKLEHGVKLPLNGKNFTVYGNVPALTGRTYVHSTVKKIVVDAYKSLESELPDKVFKYAETGFVNGGRFKPHKTHQNGLSIDFMVPVTDTHGKSTHFPTNALNRYGYDVEFDRHGVYKNYTIDFDALAAHIVALHKATKIYGVDLQRVIFAPELQPKLYATQYGKYIKQHIYIPKKRSWVRHDEHYHVDFKLKCKPLG